jgi:hypothetical protein
LFTCELQVDEAEAGEWRCRGDVERKRGFRLLSPAVARYLQWDGGGRWEVKAWWWEMSSANSDGYCLYSTCNTARRGWGGERNWKEGGLKLGGVFSKSLE